MGSEPSREVWTGDTEIETEAVDELTVGQHYVSQKKKKYRKEPEEYKF